MLEIKKSNFVKIFLLICVSLSTVTLASNTLSFDASKIEDENEKFRDEFGKWTKINKEWNEKIKNNKKKEGYLKSLSNDKNRKYCDSKFCWKENIFEFTIESLENGKVSRISKNNGGVIITNIFFNDKTEWFDKYNGQSSYWKTSSKEFWKNFVYGQRIKYVSKNNDIWMVADNGKNIEYKGSNDDYWKSFNYGENIEISFNGEEWKSFSFGQDVSVNNVNVYKTNDDKSNVELKNKTKKYIKDNGM